MVMSGQEVITALRRKAAAASAPTYVTSANAFGFSTPTGNASFSALTGDIVDYWIGCGANGCVFTLTLGTCAATGGNVIDAGPTNQGFVVGTAQKGHYTLTTGGSCTLSAAWTGGSSGPLIVVVVRGSSGLDLASTINTQNGAGTGANAVTSGSITSAHTDLCVGSSFDANQGAGTLVAGTTIAWTLPAGAKDTHYPSASEYFAQSGAGGIAATFTYGVNPYTESAISCYKP